MKRIFVRTSCTTAMTFFVSRRPSFTIWGRLWVYLQWAWLHCHCTYFNRVPGSIQVAMWNSSFGWKGCLSENHMYGSKMHLPSTCQGRITFGYKIFFRHHQSRLLTSLIIITWIIMSLVRLRKSPRALRVIPRPSTSTELRMYWKLSLETSWISHVPDSRNGSMPWQMLIVASLSDLLSPVCHFTVRFWRRCSLCFPLKKKQKTIKFVLYIC